ncbi:DUF5994 family protein [Kitasatospora sp. NBC_01287]|uniref:DUF5994 family protein n=1 Tax=Kitasatospora sp. NBC_01287 TaxID=2903573 RepID=UPI00224FF436|nr:DUF5994 family protein [Kitasatospora sp. NBC_01287]MCX4744341.1 DUF5994 family protein [Kitasatospora sp. NBC_01287]
MTTYLDQAATPVLPLEPQAATPGPSLEPLRTAARLSRAPDGVAPGRLDGAWWPRSRDLLVELPALADALAERWGQITRITVNPAQWPVIPGRIPITGHVVHAGWFTAEQDEHLIMVFSFGSRRLDLLVVPPETDVVDATRLLREAADPANGLTASGLMATSAGPAIPVGTATATATAAAVAPEFLTSSVAPADGSIAAARRAAVARTRAAAWPTPA